MLQPARPPLPAVFSGPRTVNAAHLSDGCGSNCGGEGWFKPLEIRSTKAEPWPNKGIQDNVLQENHLAIVNYPNPFSGRTTIHYSVPEKSFITLKVLNVNGNEIESLVYTQMDKGNFTIDFETGNLPAGIYFYVLSDGTSIASGKMSIVN